MKCILCGKILKLNNKYGACSNCGNRSLRQLLKDGIIKNEMLKDDSFSTKIANEVKNG